MVHFAGDAILALWPCSNIAIDETLPHAIDTCRRIHAGIQAQARRAKTALDIKIGLSHGEFNLVHVASENERQFFALGPAVERVAAAQDLANRGDIILCNYCVDVVRHLLPMQLLPQGFARLAPARFSTSSSSNSSAVSRTFGSSGRFSFLRVCQLRVCVCARARARVCVCACVRVCVCVRVWALFQA